MSFGRRTFLRAGSGALFGGFAYPSLAFADVGRKDARSLAFNNIHTGEHMAIDYWENGAYVPDALSAINHLLRDYRNNEVHVIETNLLDLLTLLHARLESSAPF